MPLSEPCYAQKNTLAWSLQIKDTDPVQDIIYMEVCAPIQQKIILSMILVLSESLLLYKDFNAILRKQNRHSFIAKICIEEYFICILLFKSAMARNGFDFKEEPF